MGLFKTKFHPYTLVELTNENCKFVHAQLGNDSSGDGTRENPWRSITRAGSATILFRGITTENTMLSINGGWIVFDDSSSLQIGNHSDGQYAVNHYAANINGNIKKGTWSSCSVFNSVVDGVYEGIVCGGNNFVRELQAGSIIDSAAPFNYTIIDLKNYATGIVRLHNSIVVSSVDLYNYVERSAVNYMVFEYVLFLKRTKWLWNGIQIPIIYNNENDYLQDVYNSLLNFANTEVSDVTDKAYFLAMLDSITKIFYADENGQTNKVVDDSVSPVFNRDGDWSLALRSDNVALFMSNNLSHVGAYKANIGNIQYGNIMNVDPLTGVDTSNIGDLLVTDGSGRFSASEDSLQTRNRMQTNVLIYPRGHRFRGLQSRLRSGLESKLYFGKRQPFSDVGAVLFSPFESIEVIPYDDANTPSDFPRWSAPLNGDCQMWYHTIGARQNRPVLFSDLAGLGLTTEQIGLDVYGLEEYSDWAVTNADFADFTLLSKSGIAKRNIPIKYCKLELNLHYADE